MDGVSRHKILEWLLKGVFRIVNGKIYSRSGRELIQRINKRNRCEHGDPRVDLWYSGNRKSIHVSHLVWMWHTQTALPEGFEIHHIDEDPTNNDFSNLLAVHPMDHNKLHGVDEEEVPF